MARLLGHRHTKGPDTDNASPNPRATSRLHKQVDDTAMSDHKGAQSALEHEIGVQRAKLISAHAVQRCLYEVLLYAEGEDAVMYAETAHVVVRLVGDAVDKLDTVHLRHAMDKAERGETAEQ
jgi:hypothetical protein